jgi:hypothetical protein
MREHGRLPSWIATACAAAVIAFAAPAAAAGTRGNTGPREQTDVVTVLVESPPECALYASVPRDSISQLMLWDQLLSTAACRQTLVVATVDNADQLPALVAGLDTAIAPALAIYREAMSFAPPTLRIVAAYQMGLAYTNILVRARAALATTGNAPALREALEPLLDHDRRAAIAAFDEASFLADDYPWAERSDSVVKTAVTSSRDVAETLLGECE